MKLREELQTTSGLLGHLADTMLRLETRKIGVEEAKSQASLVKQSNNLLRFELDKAKFERKVSEESLTVKP